MGEEEEESSTSNNKYTFMPIQHMASPSGNSNLSAAAKEDQESIGTPPATNSAVMACSSSSADQQAT